MSGPPDRYRSERQARAAALLLWLLLAALVFCWGLFTWHPWVEWAGRPHG